MDSRNTTQSWEETASCPEEFLSGLEAQCQALGTVRRIALICNQGRPNEVLWMADFVEDAVPIAQALKAKSFGFHTVCHFVPLNKDFRCQVRPQGEMLREHCDLCCR